MKKKTLQNDSPVATPNPEEVMQGFLLFRSNTWNFRRKIPVALLKYFPSGYKVIWRSLGTSDKRVANSVGMDWAAKTERVFSMLKTTIPDEMKLEYIKSELSISPTLSIPEKPKTKEGKKVKDLFDAFISHKTGNSEWSAKSQADNEFAMDLFIQVMGNLSLLQLNYHVIEKYRDKLKQIPAKHSRLKKYKGMTVQQLIDMPEELKDMPDASTVNRRMGYVSTAFEFGVQRDMLVKNPAYGVKVKELGVILPHTRKPEYTTDDIQDIVYRLRLDMTNPAHFFVPLMAIFTGGRRSELCQFYTSDIRVVNGIPCLDFNALGDTVIHTPSSGRHKGIPQKVAEKRLKKPASWRVIPIHPMLWYKLGFGGYVEHCRKNGQKKLFPELGIHRDGAGTSFSKWYDAEIAPHVVGDGPVPKTFHSFRHSIQTWFKHHEIEDINRDFAEEVVKEFIGHAYNKSGKEDLAKERYGKRYTPEIMASVLFQLYYNVEYHNITEQVWHLNSLLPEPERYPDRNPNMDYPTEVEEL
jgi:integrase